MTCFLRRTGIGFWRDQVASDLRSLRGRARHIQNVILRSFVRC
jgi:hypothetical protein